MLNDQQSAAAFLIHEWFQNTDNKQVFFLSGYAGTGKTFLVNYLIKNILNLDSSSVVFCAYTGKAVSVILQKGEHDAVTIHKLIYNTVEKEYETEDGKKVKRVEFIKKPDIPNYKLIVLDEVSMVDKKIMEDLLSYGIPVLACGDKAQLPPVGGYQLDFLDNPDYTLTEIVRQSEENTIVKIATKARNGEYIPVGNYGDVVVINRETLTNEYLKKILLGMDQVICGTNKTRIELNNMIREFNGIPANSQPVDGEKVICTSNNWGITFGDDDKFSLVNGTIGTIKNYKKNEETSDIAEIGCFKPDFIDNDVDAIYDIIVDSNLLEKNEKTFDFHQRVFLMENGTYKLKNKPVRLPGESKASFIKRVKENVINERKAVSEELINFFEFAYAISCHKSQGSEWEKVVVFDESHIFGKEANRWLYTAITRAKKKLIIIK